MKSMKKLHLLSLMVYVLISTQQAQCTGYSARALRYLQSAGSTVWQDTKNAAHWVAKNPYKITYVLFAASSYSAVKIHQCTSDQQTEQFEAIARATMDPNKPVIKMIKDTCKEHGIDDPLILLTTDKHCDLQSIRNKNRMFILITTGAAQQMALELTEQPSDFKMKHWKALLFHEIKHLKENDSRKAIISEATLRTEKFKTEAFTALTVGTAIHAATKGIPFLSKITSPKLRATAVGFLTLQGLIVTKAMGELEKKSTIFPDLANEWSKWYERRADSYVKETAFKTKNPHLLDDFSEYFKIHIKRNDLAQSRAHPLIKNRAEEAEAAAAELRSLMKHEKTDDAVIATLYPPF